LIKIYLEQYLLKNQLPSDLQDFIINGFPPNPRKIKRSLSLAYFIGKNIKKEIATPYFKLILIWSVITSYLPDLAELLRKSPYLLVHICVIVANTKDIGSLQLKIDKFEENLEWYRDNANETGEVNRFAANQEFNRNDLSGEKFFASVYNKIEPAALQFAKKHLVNNVSLYRFLKSIAIAYNIKRDPSKYRNISHGLKEVIDSAGLIS
jgi:hypothetical protein